MSTKAAGYQFMFFARDGLNSSTGVQLQQGVGNHVPVRVGRFGLDRVILLQTIPFSFASNYASIDCNSIFRIRCHNRTAKRRIMATIAIFFFFGLRNTSC